MQKNTLRLLGVFFVFTAISVLCWSGWFNQKPEFQKLNAAYAASATQDKAYLTCPVLKTRTNDFLKYHYVFHSFDSELSKRTFANYFRFLDPGKLFFLQSDIDSFAKYQNSLGSKINSKNCSFIDDVYQLYLKRVNAAITYVNARLDKPFDFTADEFIETDRKKINWATSQEELDDRWNKTLKFVLINMKEDDDSKKVLERMKKRYSLIQKEITSRTNDDINAIFLNSFALALDPHSSFLTPTDNDQFQIDFSLKLVGIGATLMSPDGYTTVDAIVPGGAAARNGRLKKGDKIIAVDPGDGSGFQDVIDMSLDKVVQLIRGKEGTKVTLVILRKDLAGNVQRFRLPLKRAVVEIKENQAKSDVMTIGDKKIGIINLPSFYIDYKDCQKNPATCRSSANDMLREIKKLSKQHVNGIVIDLRRNGGGDLTESERIVSFFIGNPVVTQVQDRDGVVHRLEVESKAAYTGPLALLISRYTASASEIFAGAVQDYGRGLILGDSKTFGKGTVQTVIDIPGSDGRQTNGAIHVTIAKFFSPNGKSNQEKGVLSDVVIPDPLDFSDVGEVDYDYALPYTTIKPSPNFQPIQNFALTLPQIQQKSAERVAKLPDYKDVQAAIAKVQKNQDTLVSLKDVSAQKPQASLKQSRTDKAQTNLPPLVKDRGSKDSDDQNEFSARVINPKDYELKEAANILVDTTKVVGRENWEARIDVK